jgi:pyruvate kinase
VGVDSIALTPNADTVKRMALDWGVEGRQAERCRSTDQMHEQVRLLCRTEKLCPAGSDIVIVAGVPLNEPGRTNLMSVRRV